jgi:hypothetical protein
LEIYTSVNCWYTTTKGRRTKAGIWIKLMSRFIK